MKSLVWVVNKVELASRFIQKEWPGTGQGYEQGYLKSHKIISNSLLLVHILETLPSWTVLFITQYMLIEGQVKRIRVKCSKNHVVNSETRAKFSQCVEMTPSTSLMLNRERWKLSKWSSSARRNYPASTWLSTPVGFLLEPTVATRTSSSWTTSAYHLMWLIGTKRLEWHYHVIPGVSIIL